MKLKVEKEDKEVADTLTTLRTTSINLLNIASDELVQPRRRRYYKIIKIQKHESPKLITSLSNPIKNEEVKDSPSPEKLQKSKGKITTLEEKPSTI